MTQTIEGKLDATGLKFSIVLSRFNEFISSKLLEGALDCLERHGADKKNISVVWVPGSFEIPLVTAKLAEQKSQDAILCLGAVIRGATDHYQYVASEMAKGIAATGLKYGIPVIFGVLTTDTIEQAIERAGTKAGNKGFDAGLAAIEMVNLFKQIEKKD